MYKHFLASFFSDFVKVSFTVLLSLFFFRICFLVLTTVLDSLVVFLLPDLIVLSPHLPFAFMAT